MPDITIGRYLDPESTGWSGWIEGTDDTGDRWITYVDTNGRPALHWPHREPTGGLIGAPVDLLAAS